MRSSQPLASVLKGSKMNYKDELKAKLVAASGGSALSR